MSVKRIFAAVLGLLVVLGGSTAYGASTVVRRGETDCRQVALTFDAGADDVSAQGIMDALVAHHDRSTFFLTSQFTDEYPNVVAAIRANGFEVGNHTYTHPDMTTLPVAQMRAELRTAQAKIMGAAGLDPRPFWRPPYGEYSATVLQVAEEEGYPWTLMWDVDTLDWQQPPAATIVSRVLNSIQPGSIVLMHLGGIHTAEAVRQMLPQLEQWGWQVVTVSEVLGLTRAGADFGGRVVYVQPGDTLYRIAGCFNTTVPILAAANDISNPNRIQPGQRIYVPLADEVTVKVNGVRLPLATPARVTDGRTLAHVRAVAEALGATVNWDEASRTVLITAQ